MKERKWSLAWARSVSVCYQSLCRHRPMPTLSGCPTSSSYCATQTNRERSRRKEYVKIFRSFCFHLLWFQSKCASISSLLSFSTQGNGIFVSSLLMEKYRKNTASEIGCEKVTLKEAREYYCCVFSFSVSVYFCSLLTGRILWGRARIDLNVFFVLKEWKSTSFHSTYYRTTTKL